jgi:hypothetical protein
MKHNNSIVNIVCGFGKNLVLFILFAYLSAIYSANTYCDYSEIFLVKMRESGVFVVGIRESGVFVVGIRESGIYFWGCGNVCVHVTLILFVFWLHYFGVLSKLVWLHLIYASN